MILFTILLTACVGLFSQEIDNLSFYPETALIRPGPSAVQVPEYLSIVNSFNPLDVEEQLLTWAETFHIPGMSVCILKNGDLYWKSHIGFANIEQNIPVTDSTAFLLSSISKLITQTAIMQLYEQGEFELEDDINDFLDFTVVNPDYPDSVITFLQLMTHTSSIRDRWLLLNDVVVWGEDSPIPLGEFLEGYLVPEGTYNYPNCWNTYPPQESWDYSNVGSAILGYLVEEMANQDFDAYCQEHIFSPLGINNASFFLSNMDTTLLATHYQWSGTFVPHLQLGWPPYPAGMLKMSALDLSKFLGMYMNHGTYNNITILNPETIELITTPLVGSLYSTMYGQMCLSWFYSEPWDQTYWGGAWTNPPISLTGIGYDKNDQWGVISMMNTFQASPPIFDYLSYFAMQYEAFSVEAITLSDTDGDRLIEPNEEFSLGLKIRNNMNVTDFAENFALTLSFNSTYISLIGDSVVNLGTINYLDEIQLPDDQFVFEVGSVLPRGNIEFQLLFTWDDGKEFTTTFKLFGGLADVLLVRDEVSTYLTQDWYLESLDSLGYETQFYDLEIHGELTQGFINHFPVLIWFTGSDAENTISEINQTLLAGYLDNGGKLFMSGQNISDELAGSDFLSNYLHVEHLEDNIVSFFIKGVASDPIGNGQQYQLNSGDALANQSSNSVVGPLDGGIVAFNYFPTTTKGAAIRYENDTYKTVFFAFGYEGIRGFNNRLEILSRILNDYFQVIVGDKVQLMSITTGISLNIFPNPLGQSTLIEFTLPQNSPVTLQILDLSGREMITLVNEVQQQGAQKVVFNTSGLPAGVYICVLKTNEGVRTKKIIKL